MDSDSDVLKKNISLEISRIDLSELTLNWESLKDESEKKKLQKLFHQMKVEDSNEQSETLDEVRDQ